MQHRQRGPKVKAFWNRVIYVGFIIRIRSALRWITPQNDLFFHNKRSFLALSQARRTLLWVCPIRSFQHLNHGTLPAAYARAQ